MLKKRSRAVSSKQGLMSDHISPPSPTTKFTNKHTASLIPSPGFFVGFSPKGFSDTEAAAVSPTSILEPKPFSSSGLNFSDRKPRASLNNSSETKHYPWDITNSKTVGLGILDVLSHEKADKESSNIDSKKVFFGSQLKVQIPSTSQNSVSQTGLVESPHSLIEFGVKNKNSQLAMALLSPVRRSSLAAAAAAAALTSEPSLPVLCLSESEMELSEDYTRVVSHGPNPRTTHIFDTCIMDSCGSGFSPLRREIRISTNGPNGHPYDDFLAFCNACRKKLGQGKDIFMYRGEKAFCSHECRNREMLFDDGMENSAHCGPPAP